MRPIRRRGPKDSPVYEEKTRDILVRVHPAYLPEESEPEDGRWFWSYTVEIENHGAETVQLVSRHWEITDSLNRTQQVSGSGVVGEQPTLKPREAFRYTSGCPLQTSSGSMRGRYQMMTRAGEPFEVTIPEFSLDLPTVHRTLN